MNNAYRTLYSSVKKTWRKVHVGLHYRTAQHFLCPHHFPQRASTYNIVKWTRRYRETPPPPRPSLGLVEELDLLVIKKKASLELRGSGVNTCKTSSNSSQPPPPHNLTDITYATKFTKQKWKLGANFLQFVGHLSINIVNLYVLSLL